MDQWIFNVIFLLFIIGTMVIRIPHQRKNKTNQVTQNHKTNLEKLLLFIVWVGMLLLPALYMFSPWLGFADYTLPIWWQIASLPLLGLSLWLFHRSHKDLGRNWSVSLEIRSEHTLITNGVYQRMRHPMYAAIWIWAVAQILIFPNFLAGWGGFVSFGLMYFLRVGKEEKMMLQEFGEAYQAYKRQTYRIFPKW